MSYIQRDPAGEERSREARTRVAVKAATRIRLYLQAQKLSPLLDDEVTMIVRIIREEIVSEDEPI